MGIHVIKMPDIGEGIAEVELAAWHVELGQTVKEDQSLADVMTDKATVEIPSPVAGRVIALGGKIGEVMAVGSELIRLEVEGAGNLKAGMAQTEAEAEAGRAAREATRDTPAEVLGEAAHANAGNEAGRGAGVGASAASTSASAAAQGVGSGAVLNVGAKANATVASNVSQTAMPAKPAPVAASLTKLATPVPALVQAVRQPDDRPLASPAVRKRAWDMGVELRFVHGSGPAGRIEHGDLDAYALARSGASPAAPTRSGYAERNDETAVPVIGLRRMIARKMQEAKRRIPHFSYVEEIDVTELEALRADLNGRWAVSRGRLTILPLLVRAMVIALRDFPQINARYDDDADVVTRFGAVHMGIATQTESGLTVPVLRHAESRDVWAIAAEIARLADAVRTNKATREDLTGSTITLSSLGALGGIVSTPVINYPEVGIVGVNRMVERPVIRDGAVVARKLMNLSSSFDHRVVDGMDAAEFIQAIRALLEQPALLFVE